MDSERRTNSLSGRAAAAPARPAAHVRKAKKPSRRQSPPEFEFDEALCALRKVLSRQRTVPRDDLPGFIARELGFQRVGSNIHSEISSVLRAAALRGLTTSTADGLRLNILSLHDADRASLKKCLLVAIGHRWQPREDVPGLLAAYTGFGRVSLEMRQLTASLINGLIREDRLETEGQSVRKR